MDFYVNRNQVIVYKPVNKMVRFNVMFVIVVNHLNQVQFVLQVLLINVLNIKKINYFV